MNRKRLFYQYLCLAIKTILLFWILFPAFFIFYAVSKIKSARFLKKERMLTYLNNHVNRINGLGNSRISNLEIEKIHKGVSNLVWRQTLSFDGSKRRTLIGKKFLPFGSFITFISSLIGPSPKHIPMSIDKRFRREVDTLMALKSDSVYTPEIVFIDPRQKLILMEYIPGTDAGDLLEEIGLGGKITKYLVDFFYNCGSNLASLHRNNISLVSHNDRSRILRKGDDRIYFVDFELSTSNDYKAWDLAIFMHWIRIKLGFSDTERLERIEKAFIEGYKKLGSLNQEAIDRHLESLRIYIPFAKIARWINRRWKRKSIAGLNGLIYGMEFRNIRYH